MKHREIINKFGGIRPMATELGHKQHTKVQGWFQRNSIPLKHIPDILIAAKANKIRLKLNDFLQGAKNGHARNA